MQVIGDGNLDEDRYGAQMAAEMAARRGESAGRLRLVPLRLGLDGAAPDPAPGASAPVRFALASRAQVGATTPTAPTAPTSDTSEADAHQLVDVLREVGALPGLRFLRADEAERADVVVYTDATKPALASALASALVSAPPDGPRAVVVVTEHPSAALQFVRAAGAVGWAALPPTSTPLALAVAITAAAQGLTVLPAAYADTLFSPQIREGWQATSATSATSGGSPKPPVAPPAPTLTARERETLELLSEGLSNKLIARRLRISEHTVKFHISALYAKLGASSRADAVSRAARRGLLLLTASHGAPSA